jgi:hypothetical protein
VNILIKTIRWQESKEKNCGTNRLENERLLEKTFYNCILSFERGGRDWVAG